MPLGEKGASDRILQRDRSKLDGKVIQFQAFWPGSRDRRDRRDRHLNPPDRLTFNDFPHHRKP